MIWINIYHIFYQENISTRVKCWSHCKYYIITQGCDHIILYALAGRELRAGQRLSMTGWQSSLHERLPIRKLLQTGPYKGPNWTKAHNQREWKHWRGPRSHPDLLPGHPPNRIPPRRTGFLSQHPPKRRRVACPTGARWHCPRGPSAHRYIRPQPRCTSGRRGRQNKFKLRTTNGLLNRIDQSACWPRKLCHVGGKYWREWQRIWLCRVGQKLTHKSALQYTV